MPDTILIVEGHVPLRSLLRDWIAISLPGCCIIEAANDTEAVEGAQAHAPRVAIVDIDVPQMDGIEAVRRIVAALPGTEVVILTLYGDKAHRAAAIAAGASACIPKSSLEVRLIPTLAGLLAHSDGQKENGKTEGSVV
jgi:DNA-binding NarL/FixJ family response regulator